MKKVILPFLMCLIIFTLTLSVYADKATRAVVNVTAVRIREKTSTESNILATIYEEDKVELLEEDGEWYKIRINNTVGYAMKKFFKITEYGDTVLSNENVQNTTNVPENTTNTVSNEVVKEEPQPVVEPISEPESTPIEGININNGDIITLTNSIKIRVLPSLGSIEKSEILQGSVVNVETIIGNWCKVTSQDISGWTTKNKLVKNENISVETPVEPVQEQPVEQTPVSTENVQNVENTIEEQPKVEEKIPETVEENKEEPTSSNRTAIVIVETARVRNSASTQSGIIDTLDEDEIVTIIGEEGDFYKITSRIGTGYISKTLVKERNVSSRSVVEKRKVEQSNQEVLRETSTTTTGNDIVEFAKQYLGYPYVLGCSTPEKGFDCSGFTRYVFGHFGYKLGQVAADQTSLGDSVERENLKAGDLILFYNDGKSKIGHCGIYISDNNFIHSANPQRGVVIDNLNTNSYYSQRFVTARRIAGG